MKKPSRNARINVEAEIAAMADYIVPRYDNLPDPVALFKRIYDAASADAPFWFDQHPMFDAVVARLERRKKLLMATGLSETAARRYDAPAQLLSNIPMHLGKLHDAAQVFTGEWDYTRRTRGAYHAVAQAFPELSKVLPKGWAEARLHYQEHDDMYAYAVNGQLKDEAAFQGIDSGGAGSGGFTNRTALTSIMYDHVEQNRKAPYAFFSAAYSHFLVVIAHNNVVGMRAAFQGLDLGDTAPAVSYDLPAVLTTGNPLVDTAIEMALGDCVSADDMRQSKVAADANEQRRAALTPEALAAEEAGANERMREIISSIFSRKSDPEVDQRMAAREVACHTRLKAHAKAAGLSQK